MTEPVNVDYRMLVDRDFDGIAPILVARFRGADNMIANGDSLQDQWLSWSNLSNALVIEPELDTIELAREG